MEARNSAVSIVVPAYNEAASIDESLRRMISVMETTIREWEIIVISDGSVDGTDRIVSQLGLPGIRLIHYSPNRGKGYAQRLGFRESRHPFVTFIDGDLDLNPSVLPSYFERLDSGEADIVIGSKMHPDSAVRYPLSRRIASTAFRFATRIVTGLNLSDTQTGLKVMRRESVAVAIECSSSNGFSFDLEVLSLAQSSGARIVDAPVILEYDFTSTVDLASIVTALHELRHASRFRRKPAPNGQARAE
jgi:glycosyltransferase involved in cell wall biosynthesis